MKKEFYYSCYHCATERGFTFYGDATNYVGRKACDICGNNWDKKLMIVTKLAFEEIWTKQLFLTY